MLHNHFDELVIGKLDAKTRGAINADPESAIMEPLETKRAERGILRAVYGTYQFKFLLIRRSRSYQKCPKILCRELNSKSEEEFISNLTTCGNFKLEVDRWGGGGQGATVPSEKQTGIELKLKFEFGNEIYSKSMIRKNTG
jgi:hypothetical protein